MRLKGYQIVVLPRAEEQGGGYFVTVPQLPGCMTGLVRFSSQARVDAGFRSCQAAAVAAVQASFAAPRRVRSVDRLIRCR